MKIIKCSMHIVELCMIGIGVTLLIFMLIGMKPYIVLSGSMEPSVPTGAIVLADTKEKNYAIGDIVSYKIENQIVTHRIVEICDDVCKTKGDANEMKDPISLNVSQIIGKVNIVIPKLGYIISCLKSKRNVLVILTVLFVSNLFDILSEIIRKNGI